MAITPTSQKIVVVSSICLNLSHFAENSAPGPFGAVLRADWARSFLRPLATVGIPREFCGPARFHQLPTVNFQGHPCLTSPVPPVPGMANVTDVRQKKKTYSIRYCWNSRRRERTILDQAVHIGNLQIPVQHIFHGI